MNAINPSLIREAVLAGLMPSVSLAQAEPGAVLTSTLQVLSQIASLSPRHVLQAPGEQATTQDAADNPSSYQATADSLVYSLIGTLLASLSAGHRLAPISLERVTRELRGYLSPQPEAAEPAASLARVALSPWQERRAKELMSSQMDKGLSIARIASECSLSRSHFSRAFKKNTGLSPRDWFLQMRLDRAKGLLGDSILSISQISLDCGFADQSHFTRVFTRVVGITPFSWRRSMSPQRSAAATRSFAPLCAN